LRLAHSTVVGWACVGRGVDDGYYDFPLVLQLFININRKAVLQRKWMEIATFLQIATGHFCLVFH
jgi:hypothetical protein